MSTPQGHADISDLIWLRIALGLSSPETICLSRACKIFHTAIEGSPGAREVWRSMLDGKSACGIHRDNVIWLHALLEWSDIAHYCEQTQRFMPLFDLCFYSPCEVASVLEAVNQQTEQNIGRMVSGLHDANVFLGEWCIPKDSMKVWRHTDSVGQVHSIPVQFATDFGVFSVTLELSMVLEDTYRLTWQVDIPLKTRMHAPYSIDVHVSGVLVPPDRKQTRALRIHDSFEGSPMHAHSDIGDSDLGARTFTGNEQVYKMLAAGEPLTCFARIAMSCMGDRCSIKPAQNINSYQL